MGMISAPANHGDTPNSLNHAAKLVQAERNGKKKAVFLAFPRRSLTSATANGNTKIRKGDYNPVIIQGNRTKIIR